MALLAFALFCPRTILLLVWSSISIREEALQAVTLGPAYPPGCRAFLLFFINFLFNSDLLIKDFTLYRGPECPETIINLLKIGAKRRHSKA